MEPFVDVDFEGVREFDQALVELLKTAGWIKSEELVRRLGVDQTDRDVMQGIDTQLQGLETYGLIEQRNPWMAVGRMRIECQVGSDGGSDAIHLEEYLKDAEFQGLTEGTLQVYKSDLKHSFEFFEAGPHDIDRHDLRDLLFHLKNEHPG